MSRWLSQVNNLLEKLDDQVETVAEDGVPNVVHTVSSRAKQLLSNTNTSSDESFQHVSEAEQVYSADSEEKEEEDYDDEEDDESEEEESDDDDDGEDEAHEEVADILSSPPSPTQPPAHVTSNRRSSSDDQLTAMSAITHDVQTEEEPESSQETSPVLDRAAVEAVQPTSLDDASQRQHQQQLKLQQQNTTKKWMQKVEHIKSQHMADMQKLQAKHSKLETELAATQKELAATRRELDQAAEIVQTERKAAADERDDLLEEQEEDLQQCKQEFEEQLQELRDQMKEQAASYEAKLASQEEDFQQEGGNLTSDLTKLREQKNAARSEVDTLSKRVSELEAGRFDLEQLLTAETERAKVAEDRASAAEKASAVVEERLDLIQSSHQKQLQQRQVRESELERTVTELSQKVVSGSMAAKEKPKAPQNDDFKDKYEIASEELVTVRTEAEVFKQRCYKLQNELSSLSAEHAEQYQASQAKLREYEEQVSAFNAQSASSVAATNRDGDGQEVERLALALEQAKKEVGSLSDQLVRQKGLTESTKSSVLALKGRLQAATTRADNAERAVQQQASYAGATDLEAGGPRQRRRIKGGSWVATTRFGQLPTRSIRNSLGMRTGASRFQRQVGDTLDALDTWILETGHILRNEPLARLGLAFYMALLHLWCFGLIAYHTVQSERTDFTTLGDRSRIPHIHHAAAVASGLNNP